MGNLLSTTMQNHPLSSGKEKKNKKYVEDITSEEMKALGFPTIQEVLADSEIQLN